MRKILLTLALLLLPSACDASPPKPKPTTVPVAGPKGEVHLLTMGDWGKGNPDQRLVAETMATYSAKQTQAIQGCLLAGDNFYVKLSSTEDPVWQQIFENVYDVKRMNFPFFPVLGNHDYEGDKASIEINYTKKNPQSRWKLMARYYRVDIPADKPIATFLMLDSTKGSISPADWAGQIEWMDQQLATVPEGVWKVIVSHHPLFSNGSHGDIGPLQTEWGPVLKKYNVDLCIAGHDHDLQHLELPEWKQTFMLVGGGGGGTRAMRRDNRGPFSKQTLGFADIDFTAEKLTARYLDKDGKELHAFERTKAGVVTVLKAGNSDKATTQPLKVIQGIDAKKDD